MLQFRSALACAAALAGAASANAGVLYGVASFNPFVPQVLYEIDTNTGAATPIGSTGLTEIVGLAFDPFQNRMFALTSDASLYHINWGTGAASFVADQNRIIPEGDLVYANGQLWATDGSMLVNIDQFTAAVSPVFDMGALANDVSGLSFIGNQTFVGYAKNGTLADSLLNISEQNGTVATIGLTGTNSPSGVGALYHDLYGTGQNFQSYMSDGEALYTLTGSGNNLAVYIGNHGVQGLSAMTAPAPGALSLAVLGGLVAARRRR